MRAEGPDADSGEDAIHMALERGRDHALAALQAVSFSGSGDVVDRRINKSES